MKSTMRGVSTFTVMVLIASVAWALAAPQVTVAIKQEREVLTKGVDGKLVSVRQPIAQATLGDVIVYTLTATNVGVAPAHDATLEDPVPQGTTLILESLAAQQPTQVSLDGGKTWQGYPAVVAEKLADGREVTVPAPATAYTRLRWQIDKPLAPGQSHEVSFKVRVN